MHGSGLLAPALVGFIAAPTIIVWHELGHYLAGLAFDLQPRLAYAMVNLSASPDRLNEVDIPVTAAGPLMDVLLVTGGLIWLLRSGARRRSSAPSVTDWIATGCTLDAGRWLRCFTGTPSHPQPADEANLSQAWGLPSWVLPYALAPVAVFLLVTVIRAHPKGMRLAPFAVFLGAGVASFILWIAVLGPAVLPRS